VSDNIFRSLEKVKVVDNPPYAFSLTHWAGFDAVKTEILKSDKASLI